MRTSHQCPKCECEFIGVFTNVMGNIGERDGSVSLGGSFPLEAYTCAECGYYELYMKVPLSEWDTPPEQTEYAFTWLRRPPSTKTTPYR